MDLLGILPKSSPQANYARLARGFRALGAKLTSTPAASHQHKSPGEDRHDDNDQ